MGNVTTPPARRRACTPQGCSGRSRPVALDGGRHVRDKAPATVTHRHHRAEVPLRCRGKESIRPGVVDVAVDARHVRNGVIQRTGGQVPDDHARAGHRPAADQREVGCRLGGEASGCTRHADVGDATSLSVRGSNFAISFARPPGVAHEAIGRAVARVLDLRVGRPVNVGEQLVRDRVHRRYDPVADVGNVDPLIYQIVV